MAFIEFIIISLCFGKLLWYVEILKIFVISGYKIAIQIIPSDWEMGKKIPKRHFILWKIHY